MAEAVHQFDSYGSWWYIDSASARDRLTSSQQQENASYMLTFCAAVFPDWTVNAIAAMCGNFQSEGVMNPTQWEFGHGMSTQYGYGLGQWTPATKLLDWLTAEGYSRFGISGQMRRIDYEKNNKIQWYSTSKYPLSFEDFLTSNDSPAALASAWLYNWERPKYPLQTEAQRRRQADEWYEYLSGEKPPTPPRPPYPIPTENGKMRLILYPAFRVKH